MIVDTSRSPHACLRPLPLPAVRLDDRFWSPRLETVRRVTLPSQYEQCERTGRIDNFRRAAGRLGGPFRGRYYNDSDVYKWLEAAAFALADAPDADLARLVDATGAAVAAAQAPDGYLDTYFALELAGERWTDLTHKHELYCAGHFIQAAVAHHRATGSAALLDVATRLADLICTTFGPQHPGTDGHEEIEMALVELARETGERRYLAQAVYFLDQRGREPTVLPGGMIGREYYQDHLPVREQREIVGHAVRAVYLACGMADVVAETGDDGLREALEGLWRSAFERKAYVTGGLGAHWRGEAFAGDFVLPNALAYAETCAAIGGFMWNWRMLLLSGEARFADWMETALYNGILAGLSLDGTAYFYQNPLADDGGHRRQPWFGTACCPPNIARLLLALPGYLATVSPEGLWLHLFAAGRIAATLPDGRPFAVRLETRYPWEGHLRLTVEAAPEGEAALLLRVPGWADGVRLDVNGAPSPAPHAPGGYATLTRHWRPGDAVDLELPLAVDRLRAHPHVLDDTGRVALRRGPLVYCLEGADHPGTHVWDVVLPPDAVLRAEPAPDLLGGVVTLRGRVLVDALSPGGGRLYAGGPDQPPATRRPLDLTAIPYYAWANRAPGPMIVWLREGAPTARPG